MQTSSEIELIDTRDEFSDQSDFSTDTPAESAPLPVLEIAGQGHLEIVPVALLLCAVEAHEAGHERGASLALGAALAAKYLPVLIVPAGVLTARGWGASPARTGLAGSAN